MQKCRMYHAVQTFQVVCDKFSIVTTLNSQETARMLLYESKADDNAVHLVPCKWHS